jgi:hypothetical protein
MMMRKRRRNDRLRRFIVVVQNVFIVEVRLSTNNCVDVFKTYDREDNFLPKKSTLKSIQGI